MRRILDEVYESRFMEFSYGFMKNRRAHQAVSRMNLLMMRKKLNYVVDADDFVCMFQYKNEARRFYQELKERLAKFDIELAEGKSKTIPFGRFAQTNHNSKEMFDFLGFTFINGKTRTNKYRLVIQTSKKKLKQKKQNVKEWLKTQMGINVLDII